MLWPSLSKRILLITAFALLPALECAGAEPAPLAELLAAETTAAGLNVTVPTGGCTQKSDFDVTSRALAHGGASIEIRRLREDSCKGNFPDGLKLVFTWDDLKLPGPTKLTIKNRISASFPQRRHITAPPSTVRHARGVSGKGRHAHRKATRYGHPRRHMASRLWCARSCYELVEWSFHSHRPRRPSCW